MKKKSISSKSGQWLAAKKLFCNFKVHAKSPRGDVKCEIGDLTQGLLFFFNNIYLMVSCGLCHTKVFFLIKDTLKSGST